MRRRVGVKTPAPALSHSCWLKVLVVAWAIAGTCIVCGRDKGVVPNEDIGENYTVLLVEQRHMHVYTCNTGSVRPHLDV
jgi:hypothetical protein